MHYDQWNRVPSYQELQEKYQGAKAYLFDMDGTLFDSEPIHIKVLHHMLSPLLSPIEMKKIVAFDFTGFTDGQVVDQILQHFPDILHKETFLEKKASLVEEELSVSKDMFLLKPLLELLKKISTDSNKLALVTSSERSTTDIILNRFDISHYFHKITTRETVEHNKPHPMPYLYTIQKLGIKPAEAIIFEDSHVGLQSAFQAGVRHIIKANWF